MYLPFHDISLFRREQQQRRQRRRRQRRRRRRREAVLSRQPMPEAVQRPLAPDESLGRIQAEPEEQRQALDFRLV